MTIKKPSLSKQQQDETTEIEEPSEVISAMNELKLRFPLATEAECQRFSKAYHREHSQDEDAAQEAAAEALEKYLQWRADLDLDSPENVTDREKSTDEDDWEYATRKASEYTAGTFNNNNSTTTTHVQLLFSHAASPDDSSSSHSTPFRTKDNSRSLYVLPARIDKSWADPETFGLVFALYLDRKFRRDDLERISLLVDLRPGKGWPNSPATQMISFVKRAVNIVHSYYPERLHRCFLLPLPGPAMMIWNLAKPFLARSIVERIVLVRGSLSVNSHVPKCHFAKHVEEHVVDDLERSRRAAWIVRN